ncbi:hypothetical protein [Dactylosporangium darangshiense]|uniref:Uncharacterized protein n=1 Tax=Dactylosporangium darangshiense TaxID=579108 RepID=A0ABP8DPC7_9ACTN
MPQLVTLRFKRPQRRAIRIWVPVLPVLLVFSPLVVLAALGAVVACLIFRVSVARAFGTGWRIVWALSGTRFDMEYDRMGVLVAFR